MSEQLVVLAIQWGHGGETFGPWVVREDGSHLDDVAAFMKRWHERDGRPDASFLVSLVTSPEAYDQRAAGT
jgi:hypothetical protein